MIISTKSIKNFAKSVGFSLCGIAKAKPLFIEKERFEKALSQNLHARKPYLEREIEKRFNPELMLENCKSVIVCMFHYDANNGDSGMGKFWNRTISKYAQIKDYHIFMKDKLEKLAQNICVEFGKFQYKTTVDSSGISEKSWAVQAGLGYFGKNGIIQTTLGSYLYIGTLLIDKEVDNYDEPNLGSCGSCSLCIQKCPTKAIITPFCVDSNRCISNINLSKQTTDFSAIKNFGWLEGCDICQQICPNNAQILPNPEATALKAKFLQLTPEKLRNLTKEEFEFSFSETAIYQLKYEGFMKRVSEINFE